MALDIVKSFRYLKWYEWIMFVLMVMIGAFYMATDKTHPLWYLIVNYICSVMGICCIFLCAHANRTNWFFAIINTALYIVVLLYNRVYGTAALEAFYYMPTNIFGLIMWKKHCDQVEPELCMTRRMTWIERAIMIVVVAAGASVYHWVLVKIGGATAWLDAFIVAIGIIATFLEVKRYADQYILWLITDVISVVQWVLLADLIMITKRSIYTVMAVIGLYNWIKLQKQRNIKNV